MKQLQIFALVVVLGALAAFAAFAAVAQTISHGVVLSCTGVVTGSTFNFYKATTSGAEAKPAIATGIATCNYTDTAVVIGTKYYYTMTETAGGVESAPSNEVSAQVVPPNAPTNPTATAF